MNAPHSLGLYARLSRILPLRSYAGKLLFVAFLGTHLPLIACVLYVLLSNFSIAYVWPVLVTVLAATLVGTGLTIWAIYRLLAPVRATSNALSTYLKDGTAPSLPTEYTDSVGLLMAHTQRVVSHMDQLIHFKNRMLGVVSHDTRGPATSIMLGCEILHEHFAAYPEHTDVREVVANIESAANHQLQVATRIVEMARDGEHGLQVQMDTENVSDLLRRVRYRAEAQARQKGHRLTLQPSEPFALPIRTDISKLEQVLQNLVENAIKFTPRGGNICLRLQDGATHIRFVVQDNGPGIPPEVQATMFDAFSTAASNDNQGSGLGLWICKTFTERLGGSIAVDSTEGIGSAFTLSFPRSTFVLDAPQEAEEAQEADETHEPFGV